MIPILVMVVMGGVIGLVVWAAIAEHGKTKARLEALALRLGLRVVEEKLSIGSRLSVVGQHQGREVKFWSYSTGSGKSRTHWAAVAVQPGATALTFEFRRQGFATKLMEVFGSKEITVGDAAFDREWFVQTNQPEFLAAALVPAIRTKFMAQPERAGDGPYKLADGWVQFAEHGALSSDAVIARLEAKLPLLRDLADVAEVAGPGGG